MVNEKTGTDSVSVISIDISDSGEQQAEGARARKKRQRRNQPGTENRATIASRNREKEEERSRELSKKSGSRYSDNARRDRENLAASKKNARKAAVAAQADRVKNAFASVRIGKAAKAEKADTPDNSENNVTKAKSVKPEKAEKQTRAAKPEKAVKQTKAAKPEKAEKQTKAAKPEKAEKQTKAAKPEKTVKQTKAAKPEKAEKQTKAAKPEKAVKQTKAAKPEKAAKQTKAAKPEKAAKQTKAAKPEKAVKQTKAVKPDTAAKQTRTVTVSSKPAIAARPGIAAIAADTAIPAAAGAAAGTAAAAVQSGAIAVPGDGLHVGKDAAARLRDGAAGIGRFFRRWLEGLKSRNLGVIAATMAVAALMAGYTVVAVFYSTHFYDGTTIYGIDCSRATADYARSAVEEKVGAYKLAVNERNGQDTISAGEIGLKYIEDGSIDKFLKSQLSFFWPITMAVRKGASLELDTEYDKARVENVLRSFSCYRPVNEVAPEDAYITRDGDQFVVAQERPGTKLDRQKVRNTVINALDSGSTEISLDEAGCYVEPVVFSDDADLNRRVNEMNGLLGARITYDFGDRKEVVDSPVIMNFIVEDGDGGYIFSPEKVWEYVARLADKYDTLGKPHTFYTSTGTTQVLEWGDYGWLMDQQETAQALLDALRAKEVATVEPYYLYTAQSRNENDIGDTYIEISISWQEMWFYSNGYLVVDTPIVTGNPNTGNETPTGGVWAIDAMMTDYTLVGADYRAPVSYWMPFNGNIGIHDMQSRYAFGGDIYLYSGSHGCINTPFDAVQQIYQNVWIGVPVIVYD